MIIFEQLGIDIGYVLLGCILMSLILIILIITMILKHNKLKKKYEEFMKGQDAKTLENLIVSKFDEIDSMKEHLNENDERLKKIDGFLLGSYNKMSIVKYDAFREMGGNMSFVLALLTESNDGFILNTMHSGREGCYTYLKNIVKGECDAPLSEEEREALDKAVKR